MFGKGFILVALVTAGGAQTAWAQTSVIGPACQTISDLRETVSIARTLQTDQTERRHFERVARLNRLVNRIALPSLIPAAGFTPAADIDTPSVEPDTFTAYMTGLREVTASLRSGAHSPSDQPAIIDASPEVIDSLKSLDRYYKCSVDDPSTDADISASGTRAEGAPSETAEGAATPRTTSSAGEAGGRDRVSANRSVNRASTGTRFDMQSGSLLVLLIFLSLVGIGTLYARKRSKTFTTREQRKMLHAPVTVRLGKKDCEMFIVDISMNGFKIQHPGLIQRQRKLRVWINGQWHIGRIRWSNNLFAGVRFTKPINQQTLDSVFQ